ncbi:hypothetical protein [Facklamia hominis]|uniref:hypothetical protein n=1 Tax=Facklamia hominis TaxID=178214 RepID=UPI002889C385|nr:hypothetical protein [Facklamia hominis]
MTKKDKLKLDLQMFADKVEPSENTGKEEDSAEFTPEQQEKINRLIAQAKSKAKDEAKTDNQQAIEDAVAEAIEKEREVAKLKGKELEEYKQKEAEKKYQAEIEKRDRELEELRKKDLLRTIRDEAHAKLAEFKLPDTEESIALLEADTLDEMAEKADLLAKYTSVIKNSYARSQAPLASGGLDGDSNLDQGLSVFDKARQI